MRSFLHSRLGPFRHANFRRFFFVQSISLIGTWAHDLARSWIILNLFGSASALGSMLLATALPGLALTLQGGVLADRADVKRIMTWTKSALALSALALAFFAEFERIQMWHLLLYGVIEGCVVAFDAPTFQALTVRLVPREEFQQAIALNSTNFHAARMLGPVVGGALLALHGPSLVFLFDAASYAALALALRSIRLNSAQRPIPARDASPTQLLAQGLRYAVGERRIRYVLWQLMLAICLASPILAVIFRSYLNAKFGLTSAQFGTLFMFPALGSMAGATSFAVFPLREPLRALAYGVPLGLLGILSVPLAPTSTLAGLSMTVAGFGLYLSLASLTISVHLTVEEEYRGRVSSIIGLGFNSVGPLMSFPIGLYSDWVGAEHAIFSLAAAFGVGSAALAWRYRAIVGPALRQAGRAALGTGKGGGSGDGLGGGGHEPAVEPAPLKPGESPAEKGDPPGKRSPLAGRERDMAVSQEMR